MARTAVRKKSPITNYHAAPFKSLKITSPSYQSLSDKTLLVINTGWSKKKFIFQRLKKLGITVIMLHKEKNWAAPYIDEWILADTYNHREAIRAVDVFIKSRKDIKIDGVLTFWEDDVLLTAKIVDKFNLIGIPFDVAKKARNKFLFREFCMENGIPAPRHHLINSSSDLETAIKEIGFPMVIKPAYGCFSAYVIKIDDKEDLYDTYKYLRSNMSATVESSLADGTEILVEEYIDGEEVDVDILLQNGKIKFFSISDNDQTNEPFFVETGQSIPSHLPLSDQQELVHMCEETLEKMGVMHGVLHFEAKSTSKGPVPIEVNLRMGGDEVWSFVRGAWGVDMIEEAAKIACGIYIYIQKPDYPKKYITGKYFLSDYSGIIVQRDVSKGIKTKKYLEEIHFNKKIGEPILVPPEGYEFLGWVTVSGDNLLDAQDNLKDALKHIKYKVVKFDTESSLGKTSRKSRFSTAVLNKDLLLRAAKVQNIRRISKMNQRKLHIGITYATINDEKGTPETKFNGVYNHITQTLKERGYQVSIFDFNNVPKAIIDLKKSDVDLVFNVCEGINNLSMLRPHAAALLDTLQIPYTGSSSLPLSLSIDKISFKKLLTYHDIPTPDWDYAYSMDDEIRDDLIYPLIVKPSNTDNSIGVTNKSVVENKKQLYRELEKIIEGMKRPALIEEYIEGDEYDVSILGSDEDDYQVLPLSRTIFKNIPEGYWHILTYDAKWRKHPAYRDIIVQRPAKNINKKLEALITEIALDTYSILDCNDYGRAEIRVDADNNPYVLELNPNPALQLTDGIAKAAELSGYDYGDLLEDIIRMTIKRYKSRLPDYAFTI